MKESFIILVKYQDKEYGEVEEAVERVKYRMEEWMEHEINLDEMEILHIDNHMVTHYSGREFINRF